MLQVYILEDNDKQRQTYQQLIENYLFIEALDMRVVLVTADPQILLNAIRNQRDLRGLFFLDIELKDTDIDGISVAEQLRAQLNFAEIVFVTTHSEMAFLTLERKVEPLDYVLKDNGYEEVAQNIRDDIRVAYRRYQNHVLNSQQHFSYRLGSRLYEMPMSTLNYIATVAGQPGKIEVHSETNIAEFMGNLTRLEQKYPNLFRCHKSFLINPERIANYDAKKRIVTMIGGGKCEVSFRKESKLRHLLQTVD